MSTNPNPKRRSLWVKNRLVALEASVAAGGEDLTTALAFISDCHHVIQSHRPNPEALEAAGMDWDRYLGNFSSLHSLDLSGRPLYESDFKAISCFVEQHPAVHTVSLCETGLSDDLAAGLAQEVLSKGRGQALKRLDLTGNFISAEGCSHIARAVSRRGSIETGNPKNPSLKALRLRKNFIGVGADARHAWP